MLSAHTYTHCSISHITLRCACESVTYTQNHKNNNKMKNRTTEKNSVAETHTYVRTSSRLFVRQRWWLFHLLPPCCCVLSHQLWLLVILCHFLLAWICLHLGTLYSFELLSISCHRRQAAIWCICVCVCVRAPNQWQWQGGSSSSGSYSGAWLGLARSIWWHNMVEWCFLLLFAGFLSHWFTSVSRQATLWAPHNCFYYSIITY